MATFARCCMACLMISAGCAAVDDIEQISRVHAECKQDARKQTESDKERAHLEEQCFERRRAEWAK